MQDSTYEGRWLTPKQMADVIQRHPYTLINKAKKLTKDGIFIEGIHYFKTGSSHSSTYQWNYTEIRKTFSEWRAPSREVQDGK